MSALPSIAPSAGRPTEADAAADLYARHADRIFGYCLGLLRNREEAEDAVQTTFLNAYRGLRRGIRPEFEAAWLFKIAQNVCRTRQSNAWRRGRIESVRDLDALQDAVAAPEHDTGQAAVLADALQELPDRYRTVILLREWQGLSYREIAEATGQSEAAIEMLVFRARRALAERLERADVRSGALSLSSLYSLLKSLLGGAGLKAAATGLAATAAAIAVATLPGDEGVPSRVPPPASQVERATPSADSHRHVVANSSRNDVSATAVPPAVDGGSSHAPPSSSLPSSSLPSRPAVDGSQHAPPSASSPNATPTSSGAPPTNVTVPADSVPVVTVPSATVPSTTVPSTTLPAVNVPGTSISTPSVTTPAVTVPSVTVDPPAVSLDPSDIQLP